MDKCNLCGERDFVFLFSGHDYLSFSPLAFRVMRCNKCSLVCLNPRPKEMVDYYNLYHKGMLERDVFLFLLPDRVRKIKRLKTIGRILDIGCGTGGFLSEMQKEGWDVYGCDIYPDACDTAKKESGLKNVYNEDILFLNFPEKFFDIITLWHVLEHLTNPQEALKKINYLLKEDGILIIESPDFSSWQSRFFRDKWYALDLPRHLYQFSPEVLERILESAGVRIFKRDYIVNPRVTFISLKKSLLRHLKIERFLHPEELEKPIAISNKTNGMLWIWARAIFNLACFLFTIALVIIHQEDSFRVYCKKGKKR